MYKIKGNGSCADEQIEEQNRLKKEILESNNKVRGIEAPTGFGKTYVYLAIGKERGQIIIATPNRYITKEIFDANIHFPFLLFIFLIYCLIKVSMTLLSIRLVPLSFITVMLKFFHNSLSILMVVVTFSISIFFI